MRARLPSFWIKVALIAAAVGVADVALFEAHGLGANVGVVGLTWVAVLALATPAVLRDPLARVALAAAAALALLQFERPTFVGILLYVLAMGVASLAPRAPRGDDGWRWAQRLFVGAVIPLVGPFLDLARLRKAQGRGRSVRLVTLLLAAALPVLGGLLFLSLFAAANPVIARVFEAWRAPEADFARLAFWAFAAFPVWVLVRPRGLRATLRTPGLDGELRLPFAGSESIVVSLALFNVIFAVQNGLDIAYLWSGAGLPSGVTFAEYAHQGAYPLIATALLAGLFVLVFLRPGSETASRPLVRWLVIAWVAQNVFLVASTALRTIDYVEAYSLTEMRIAALFWMALVATGLGLILWRVIARRSTSWLLNRNLSAVGAVLLLCSIVDLNAIAAAWNVRHAREVGGRGVALDDEHLSRLGGAAIVSLAELEARSPDPQLRERAAHAREHAMEQIDQTDWRSWRWRDARRLARVDELIAQASPLSPPATPLTPSPKPGT